MPRAALYHHRSQQGLCPRCGRLRHHAWFICRACQDEARARQRTTAEARRLAPGPNRVACCGAWHPITQTPLTVPCCGRIFFKGAGTYALPGGEG